MSGFHRLNTTPLVLGLLLLGFAGAWGAREIGWIGYADFPLVAASLLVVSGTAGIAAFLTRRPEVPGGDSEPDTIYRKDHR